MTSLLLLLDIASGLQYLHSRNIVHGDLKPANILLSYEPMSPTGVVAKLSDFGLSARLDRNAAYVPNYNSGTPFYVAPEVVYEHMISPASDIFALGVIMWQLFTGLLPYQASAQGRFIYSSTFPHFIEPPPPQDYQSLTHRCLQRIPEDRPSATELIEELRSIYTVMMNTRKI